MPNRILKESIRTSKKINALTDFQFRVWTYLITYADDYGRGSADPELLKGFVFPRRKRVTEADIGKALADLAGMGCISLYHVDGESYFCFPNWGDHQRIQNKRSNFPAPEDGKIINSTVGHGDSPLVTVGHGDSPPESNPIQSESNPNPNPNTKGAAPDGATRPRFSPPTVEDVASYCHAKGYAVDAEQFCDFYTSNGWMVGKNRMKDWKAAVRTWAARRDNHGGGGRNGTGTSGQDTKRPGKWDLPGLVEL
jgi:hypothetical protein